VAKIWDLDNKGREYYRIQKSIKVRTFNSTTPGKNYGITTLR